MSAWEVWLGASCSVSGSSSVRNVPVWQSKCRHWWSKHRNFNRKQGSSKALTWLLLKLFSASFEEHQIISCGSHVIPCLHLGSKNAMNFLTVCGWIWPLTFHLLSSFGLLEDFCHQFSVKGQWDWQLRKRCLTLLMVMFLLLLFRECCNSHCQVSSILLGGPTLQPHQN